MRSSRFLFGKRDVKELLLGKRDRKELLIVGGTVFVTTLIINVVVTLVSDWEPPLDKVIVYGVLAVVVLVNGTLITLARLALERHRSRLAKGMRDDDAGTVTPH